MDDKEIDGKLTEVTQLLTNQEFVLDILKDYKRSHARNYIIILLLAAIIFISNTIWLWQMRAQQKDFVNFLSDYNFLSEDYSQDGNGYNNINTGSQGDVINGAETENKKNDTQK